MTGCLCCQQPFAVKDREKELQRKGRVGGEQGEGGGDRAAEEGHYWN